MSKDGRIWLSHTGLEMLERCPRCFWLQYQEGVRQPEGIVSRLANRFDTVLKEHFQRYRNTNNLPPMVEGKLDGILQNPFQEKYWARINDKYGFFGKLDECLINKKGELTPVDFKTSSSDPRDREIIKAYQTQIDDYIYLISQNHNKTSGYGYLVYFYPDVAAELHKGFPMIVHIVKVTGNPNSTQNRIKNAIEVIEGKIPMANPMCVFCNWYQTISDILKENKKSSIIKEETIAVQLKI
jgi:hypothetical protein